MGCFYVSLQKLSPDTNENIHLCFIVVALYLLLHFCQYSILYNLCTVVPDTWTLDLWTFLEVNGPRITNIHRGKQILAVTHMCAVHCHSCAIVSILYSAIMYNNTVIRECLMIFVCVCVFFMLCSEYLCQGYVYLTLSDVSDLWTISNLKKLIHKLRTYYMQNEVWLCHDLIACFVFSIQK